MDHQPPLLERPGARLLARLRAVPPGQRWLVGLTGVPGSGKSTLAVRLAEEVNAVVGTGAMSALGMDGFHLTKAQLRARPDAEAALARRGAPWTFDATGLADRLRALRAAAGKETVSWPDFQHDTGDPEEGVHSVAASAGLVLVEGLYLARSSDGWGGVRTAFDELWYLDTPLETALARLTARHMAAWNLTESEARQRIAANDALNAQLVVETRENVDWLVR